MRIIYIPKPVSVFTPVKYGLLYNWYAASNANFAPAGWHVATEAEYSTLWTYIGGTSTASDKIRETGVIYWIAENGATNEYGFNARGGGARYVGGTFSSIRITCGFWKFDSYDSDQGLGVTFGYVLNLVSDGIQDKKVGYSVRLLKNDSTDTGSLTDIDGNVYPTVKIGDQVWLAANWACTKLNDGTPIANVTDNSAWAALTTGAYCWYNNDINNK